jgi:predicted transcriptional regulator
MTVAAYIAHHGLNPSSFAKQLGVTRAMVHRWLAGVEPDAKSIRRIVEVSKGEITANDVLGISPDKGGEAA